MTEIPAFVPTGALLVLYPDGIDRDVDDRTPRRSRGAACAGHLLGTRTTRPGRSAPDATLPVGDGMFVIARGLPAANVIVQVYQ